MIRRDSFAVGFDRGAEPPLVRRRFSIGEVATQRRLLLQKKREANAFLRTAFCSNRICLRVLGRYTPHPKISVAAVQEARAFRACGDT
jgi:hypothetical protein